MVKEGCSLDAVIGDAKKERFFLLKFSPLRLPLYAIDRRMIKTKNIDLLENVS